MIEALQAAAERVTAAIHEHREQGDGFATLCKSLGLDVEELNDFIDHEVGKLNGSGTPEGALMHGILIGAVLVNDVTEGDGLDWAAVGKLLPPHDVRTRILRELLKGPSSPNQMADALGEALGNVSYHVKALAGTDPKAKPGIKKTPLVELTHTEPRRGAVEHFYRLTDTALTNPEAQREKEKGEADAA